MGYDNLSHLATKISSGAFGTQVNEGYSCDAGANGKRCRRGMTDGSD